MALKKLELDLDMFENKTINTVNVSENKTDVTVKIPLPSDYFTNSPVSESDLDEYLKYETEFLTETIKKIPLAAGEITANGAELNNLTIINELPKDRTSTIKFNPNKEIRNPSTGGVRIGAAATMVIKTDNKEFKKELKNMLDAWE